jgi:hypothetical protein
MTINYRQRFQNNTIYLQYNTILKHLLMLYLELSTIFDKLTFNV